MIFHLGCQRVCMFCQQTYGYKEGEEGTKTHGICPGCLVEPFKRETLIHVVGCRVCGCVSFRMEDVLVRCDEGRRLLDKWHRAAEQAKAL